MPDPEPLLAQEGARLAFLAERERQAWNYLRPLRWDLRAMMVLHVKVDARYLRGLLCQQPPPWALSRIKKALP